MEVERIPLGAVRIGERRRHLDAARVADLKTSIESMGLRTPITVRIVPEMVDEDGVVCDSVPILVAGGHRLEAARQLGWEHIDAFVMGGDETDARLWEIAENLHRSELTVQERADHIAEWVKLTDEKAKGAQVAHPGGKQPHDAGVSKAAAELGVSRRDAQRAVKIASITDEAKEAAREAGLDDNQSALLKVAAADPEEQTDLVHWLAEQKAERRGKRETNAAYDKMTKEDATERLAALLAENMPGEHWTACTALLYSAGCANVAKALNRLTGAPVFDQTSAGRAA